MIPGRAGGFKVAAGQQEPARASDEQRMTAAMSDTGQPGRGGTAPEGKIGVFLLDDHEIVRRGVRELLEAEPDIVVVGEAGTAASALARIPALRPDVAVLDVRLPDGEIG